MCKQIVLLSCFLCFSISCISQSTVDVNKDIDVLKVYSQYVTDGYGTPDIYNKLANGYYFRNEYEKAKLYFEKLFQTTTPSQTSLSRYTQTLRALKIDVANNQFIASNTMH